jgi:hypothetical protein
MLGLSDCYKAYDWVVRKRGQSVVSSRVKFLELISLIVTAAAKSSINT